MTRKPPRRERKLNGFRIGDRVLTPLGRVAIVTGLRDDGYLDARYENWGLTTADTILQAATLQRVT